MSHRAPFDNTQIRFENILKYRTIHFLRGWILQFYVCATRLKLKKCTHHLLGNKTKEKKKDSIEKKTAVSQESNSVKMSLNFFFFF